MLSITSPEAFIYLSVRPVVNSKPVALGKIVQLAYIIGVIKEFDWRSRETKIIEVFWMLKPSKLGLHLADFLIRVIKQSTSHFLE
jgi:hypothetical protein